MGFKN